ncbi:Putative nuclease HARBI1 [Cyphomyrmex costatus]|uniref:Putative nuclease HARBI1 n=1 Tax=Cyphomyrmex costatus TaxID=456900 RepID=A0A151IJL6_9HYME|nr:Putative nuclease HARBI1 [Cyphomyrmex costatus]
MAVGFLIWELMVLQERVRQMERRIERRMLRDVQNPFDLPHNEFMHIFRISPDLAMELTNLLRPDLIRQRSTGISPEIQTLITIQFYAHGSYQRPTGDQFNFNVSQPVVSRCLHAVTTLINQHLLRRWVQFPMTREARQEARTKFRNAPQPFEGAIGAIDCTFINILGPTEHEEAFVNHHGNHSLNVQAIVDPDMRLLNINSRWPGARNDSFIWTNSPIRRAMKFHYDMGERRTWLIGDSGYPLEPWLMTPLPQYRAGTRQFQYTIDLCKARNVIERFFGCFKGMWRCLSYQRVLMYDPTFAGHIVNACAVLHNMRLHYRLPADDFYVENEVNVDMPIQDVGQAENEIRQGPRAIAQRIQDQIMRERYGYVPEVNLDPN